MNTEKHISILHTILPNELKSNERGEIYRNGAALNIRYTPEFLWEISVDNPEYLLAIEKDNAKPLLPNAVGENGKLLFAKLNDAIRFNHILQSINSQEPRYHYWTREEFAQKEEKQEAYVVSFAKMIVTDFCYHNGISNTLDGFIKDLKRTINKIDNPEMLEFIVKIMTKVPLTDVGLGKKVLDDAISAIKSRIADIRNGKTLYGKLKSAFIDAYREPPKFRANSIIDYLNTIADYNDDIRPVMTGVYRDPNGWYVSTDSHILAAVAADRIGDIQKVDTIVTPKGKLIDDGKYPNWQAVIPTKERRHELSIDIDDFWRWLTQRKRQAKLKKCDMSYNNAGTNITLRIDYLHEIEMGLKLEFVLQFISLAKVLGNGKIYRNDTNTMLLYETDEKNPSYILCCAMNSRSDTILDDVYYDNVYDLEADSQVNATTTKKQPKTTKNNQKQPAASDDEAKAKRLRLAKAKAKAAIAILELMKI